MKRYPVIFKVFSSTLACIFLWNQICWAGDLINAILEQQYIDQSQTFAPDYLQTQQNTAESLVSQKQAIEDTINTQNLTTSTNTQPPADESLDLKGPRGGSDSQYSANNVALQMAAAEGTAPSQDEPVLSVTTQAGDIIHYKDSKIDSIEKKDGTVLRNLTLDENNNLLGAEITYPDGTIQTVANGKVSQVIKPDEAILNYNDEELISSIIYPDGKIANCSYTKDTQGNILETILTDSKETSRYDNNNRLKKVEFNDGKTIEYDSGVISKIIEPDNGSFIFDIKNNLDGTITSSLAQYLAASGTIYRYVVDENSSPTSITVEKSEVVAAYNKDGVLLSITKDGHAITSGTISQTQADYDAALALYQEKKQYAENYQINLDNANMDLINKATAKDTAAANLNTAVQNLNSAQSIKDTKQTAYDTSYNDYVAAQVTYDSANTALNSAKAIEVQASQDLTNAQNTLAAKQTILNNKTAARQAIQATIADLNTKIQADQTNLSQAQQNLNNALNEEQTAQTDYNNAQADVNAKQTAYNNAVEDREAKEAVLNTASANLTAAQQTKTSAENALSDGNPYIVSSYTYSPSSIVLNQYKNFINDQFDSYNSSIWCKPVDSLVTIGSGTAVLKGTGKNYNAAFYANQSYSRADKPVLSTTFKVSSTSGRFIAALDGYTSSNSHRRVGVYVYGGKIYLQTMTGSTTSNIVTLISSAKANTNYTVEFEVTPEAIKVYLWESSGQRPVNSSYTYSITNWTAVRPYYSLYSGTATVDYAAMRGPNYNSTYDSNSNLVKDVYQNGNTSIYSYSQNTITVSDYKRYLDTPYSLSTQGLWYKPADSLVTLTNGIATLKGTGSNYNATFYSNQTFAQANDVMVRSAFQASSTSGKFIAAVDGYTSSNAYRRVGITMQSGKIYVQTVSGSSTSTPVTLITTAKADTNYTVEFQATAQNIKIYLWESSTQRPASPSYTYTITNWSSIRPYFSVYSGTAAVSNIYINYIPQLRTISSSSPEYSQILARNELVKNLNDAITNVNTAQNTYNAANAALNNAKAVENQANQNLTNAQNALTAKQTTLNSKIAARQAIQATIASLNNEIQTDQASLAQTQQNLNQALSEESTAQSDYNNAQTNVNTKQTAYNSAVQDRQAKETALSTASTNLAAKTTARDQVYMDLQTALQGLSSAQAAKDTSQNTYNSAYADYLASQTAYDQASTTFNNAKSEEDTAKAHADSLLETLNILSPISSMFPSQDSVLTNINNELGIVSVLYDSERRIQQIYGIDGTIQSYTEGLTSSILSGSESTLYSYGLDALNNIEEITVDRDGIKRLYDKYGNLSRITTNEVSLDMQNNEIVRIEKEEGTIIEDAVFDADNNIINAKITKPDGVKAVYAGGVLTEARQPDGSTFYYNAQGSITKLVNNRGISYIYSDIEEGGRVFTIAVAENQDSITDPEETVYQKYNSDKKLIESHRKDGVILTYSYTADSTIVSDGKTVTSYDENNNIKKVEVRPTSEDPVSTISEYEYGRIRKVYKGNDLIYKYTYEFDEAGKEITVIEDVKTDDFKRYKDELLISITDSQNLITSYEYNSDKKISKSIVTHLGNIVNQYAYTYEGDNTIIEDIDGLKRTYNKDDKLTLLEEGGRTYAYTYQTGSDGKEESIQELIKITDESGAIANYEKGELKSIAKPDGIILSDFVFGSSGTFAAYSVLKDGIKYFIEDGHVVREIKADQTIIEYYTDGLTKSLTSPAGGKTDYSYEKSVDGAIISVTVNKNGKLSTYDKDGRLTQVVYDGSKTLKYIYEDAEPAAIKGYELIDKQNHCFYDSSNRLIRAMDSVGKEFNYDYVGNQGYIILSKEIDQDITNEITNFTKNNLITDSSGTIQKIKLDSGHSLDFGDGSDGDLRVEAGQTIMIDGTKNYKSIYIAPGAILTVSPWNGSQGGSIFIKCTGSVNIEGTLQADSKGYRGGSGSGSSNNIAPASGESYCGIGTSFMASPNGGGGGCGYGGYAWGAGGGGGYGSAGESRLRGQGGNIYGDIQLTNLYMGSGGGGGGYCGGNGGTGGGKIKIIASTITITGILSANGGNGTSGLVGGGGGSGGSIWLVGSSVVNNGSVTVNGGLGGNGCDPNYIYGRGGNGGNGRIRIDCKTFVGNMPMTVPYMNQVPYDSQGILTSDPIETNAVEFGNLLGNTEIAAGTNIRFKTRAGASEDVNDGSWSGWIEVTKSASGYKINSPANKYIQYQAILETSDGTKTPSICSNGDYAIKLTYSYNRAFDANAPPEDVPFKEFLKFTSPEFPIPPQIPNLQPDFASLIENPANIESCVLPNETIIETKNFKEDSTNITVETSKDNKITYYVEGKVQATYQKHADNHLELLTEYSYDNEGNLISISLPSARNSIDTQILTARQQISAERANYLRNIAQQKGLAYTQIRDQVQAIRDQISSERSSLQSQLYQEVTRSRWVGWWIFGWYETYTERVEVPGVRDGINQLNEQERQLNDEESRAYAQLDSEVSAAEQKLIQDEGAALIEVNNQEKAFHDQIIKEESTPVILEYYRSILGRDPDDAETEYWLSTVTYDSAIDVNALKTTLLNSNERIEQEVFTGALKGRVRDALYNYLTLDEGGKESALQALGLSLTDAVTLTVKDVDAILSFLDKQNIHFGRSAFVSLAALLKENNITYDLDDVALKSILIDIFTGSLDSLSDNNLLELSMYSVSKTASLYGLTLYNTKLNYDDLTAAFNAGGKVIAHFKNNHFVVVTNISSDGKISYIERNRGKDGYTWTVSKEEFQNAWTGYSIVKGLSPEGTVPSGLESKVISTELAQRIKGSCLEWLGILIWGLVTAVTSVATAVVGAIGAIVTGISAVIGPIIAGIGTLITNVAGFMIGIGSQLFSAISFVGTSLLPALGQVGSWLGGIGSFLGNALGLGGIISSTGFNLTGLGLVLGKTVVSVALSIGISKGLESLGVNSTISGLLSSFVTGGVSGLFNSGFSALSFITGGLQGLAIQGVNELAPRLGIDPMLSNVISMTAGSFIGAVGSNISPTTGQFNLEGFSASIDKTILPNVASEFSYYGITKAGELLGVDPRISYLTGSLIRSYINPGIDPETGNPRTMWQGITDGLLQGVTNIGLNYATSELGLDPLLANLGFSAIASAIKAGIQAATGGSQDIFGSLFKTYEQNALSFLGYSDPDMPMSPWQQAAYLSQILDFSDIVQERGLIAALNTYGAGFFNAVTVNAIVQSGTTLGRYFDDKLKAGQYTLKTINGKEVAAVDTPTQNDGGKTTALFERVVGDDGTPYWNPVGKEEALGNSQPSWSIGELGVDAYGKLGYTDADLYTIFDSDIQYQKIQDGQQAYAEIKDLQGRTLLVIEPTVGGHYNIYNSYGEYVEAKITNLISNRSYTFDGLKLEHFSELDLSGNSSLLDFDLSNPDFVNLMLNNLSVSLSEATAFNNLTIEEKQQVLHVLLFNGIGNPEPTGVSPAYMRGFGAQLALADPLAIQTTYIASYENSPGLTGKVRNAGMWLKDVYLSSDEITDDIIKEINYKFNGNPPADMVGLAHSGDGDPLIQALNKQTSFDMKSVVLVGAPLKYGRQITNPNVENVISIEGGLDAVVAFAGGYFWSFEDNPRPLNLYRIALLNVDHFNYSYDPASPNPDSLKVKAAKFTSRVTQYANNTIDLGRFLTTTKGISYDSARKIYFVDLNKVTYEE